MHGFATYDIVKARQAAVEARATQLARHTEGSGPRSRARTLRVRLALATAGTPLTQPACCAA